MPTVCVLGVSHGYDLTLPTSAPIALVFVHGWLLSRHYWQPLIEALQGDYQCLAYDLRGFGSSQLPFTIADVLPSGPYGLAAYAKDLGVLLEQLGLSKVWLVGHSLGGNVALWAAELFPDQVQGVICVNAGGGIYLKEEFERFRTAGQQIVRLRSRWLARLPFLEFLFMWAGTARLLPRKWAKQRLIDFVTAHPDAALGSLLDSTTEAEVHRLPHLVSHLKQPVYFITGSQDKIMEPKYVRHLASFHPLFGDRATNVFEIPNCGHLAMLEQPATVAAQIRQAIANHD